MKLEKKIYRIVDTTPPDEVHPYSLLGPDGTVLSIGNNRDKLSQLAWHQYSPDEVSHEYDYHKAAQR